jgi:hypothetical protein
MLTVLEVAERLHKDPVPMPRADVVRLVGKLREAS